MARKLTVFGTIEYGDSQVGNYHSPTYIGGNGVLASLAASKHVYVNLMGVIGSDLEKSLLKRKLSKRIDIQNVEQYQGNTFRYKAVYSPKNFEIIDQGIHFGVYEEYKPKVTLSNIKHTQIILFSGSNPKYSLGVLHQLKKNPVIAVNTLFYHLQHNFESSKQLIQQATYLFVSKREYNLLTKKLGKIFVFAKNLRAVFVTNGEIEIKVIMREKSFSFPISHPVTPLDPTNAGDVFTGTVMGMIAKGFSLNRDIKEMITQAQKEAVKVISNNTYYRKVIKEKNETILEEIAKNKILEVKAAKRKISLRKIQRLVANQKIKIRSFSVAIRNANKIAIIGEVKKASPSAGIIRKDFNPVNIAKVYQKSGLVDAISVLTDEKYFQGNISFIQKIKSAVKLPILRKDFIVDEYQIYESRLHEVDAILLIVSLLKKEKLKRFIDITHSLDMECIVEVHSERELQDAIYAGAKIIGINTRDLKTFTIDKTLFEKLSKNVPSSLLKVAESGIENNHDLKVLCRAHANAVLIGTSLMKVNNVKKKLIELTKGVRI